MLGLYRDNGKYNGNDNSGCRAQAQGLYKPLFKNEGVGFRVQVLYKKNTQATL